MADNAFILEKSMVIMLAELQDMEISKKVTMNIKVVEVKDPVELASRTKHDVTVEDSIGHCKGGRAHGNYSSSMHESMVLGKVLYDLFLEGNINRGNDRNTLQHFLPYFLFFN